MTSHYLAAASSYAHYIDNIIWLVFVLVGFWFLLAQGVFFWFLYKFRHQPGVKAQYITGEKEEEMKWIHRPHNAVLVCDLFIVAGAIWVWHHVKQELPKADAEVRIIAQQWSWSFVQPGPDGKLDTPDDIMTADTLHVELDKTYHFKLESRDVLHSFSVPAFRLKQDAIPGRVITGWFKPTLAGKYDIQCAEICGIGHGIMAGRVHIETPAEHTAWMASQGRVAVAAPPPPAPAPAAAPEPAAQPAAAPAPTEAQQ